MLNTLHLCFDKWAELIKSLKTQQSISRRYMAFKPVLSDASCITDIAGFGEISDLTAAWWERATPSHTNFNAFTLSLQYFCHVQGHGDKQTSYQYSHDNISDDDGLQQTINHSDLLALNVNYLGSVIFDERCYRFRQSRFHDRSSGRRGHYTPRSDLCQQ